MRIAFDHQAFCRQKTGGISRYFCRLSEHLFIKGEEVGIFAPIHRNQYLRNLSKEIVHGFGMQDYPPKSSEIIVSLNGLIARTLLQSWKPNVVHETYFSSVRSYSGSSPTVLTVFDMIPEILGAEGKITKNKASRSSKYAAVSRADHIICISEYTKQDLIRIFDINEDKVSVVHLGCDTLASSLSDQDNSKVRTKPYLLYVGLRDGYKNFSGMLHAVAASRLLKSSFDIVAFGKDRFNEAENNLISKLGYSDGQVRQLEGDDEILSGLYKHAAALVYPSKYEGFGLPPIEAMNLKCPVVSSYASCMPEVIGNAAEYFDPGVIESMTDAIEKVVFSEDRTNELIENGIKRAQYFTWDLCAKNTLKIYQSLASGKVTK